MVKMRFYITATMVMVTFRTALTCFSKENERTSFKEKNAEKQIMPS